jgi:hypothetical protein
MRKKEDMLAEKIEKLIIEYDVEKKLTDAERRKIGRLFSVVIRTSHDVRELFFSEVKALSGKVKKRYEEANNEILEKLINEEKKDKIFN